MNLKGKQNPKRHMQLDKLARTISKADKQRAAAYLDQCAKATLRDCFPQTPYQQEAQNYQGASALTAKFGARHAWINR